MQIIAIPCGPVMANSYIVRREGSPHLRRDRSGGRGAPL